MTTLERPRFFPRQLITPDDLTLAQDYLRDKMRRIIRYLHGWGVVCGAQVEPAGDDKAWRVLIEPGYILGPYGDEILIEREICFDLRTKCLTVASGGGCDDMPAVNGCGGKSALKTGKWFVAVRYKEFQAGPVRVYQSGCGCSDKQCEYSRYRDGYEICLLPRCPGSHSQTPTKPDHKTCPPEPTDPWVVLASVQVGDTGVVKADDIDNCECRRIVISFADSWTTCKEDRPPATGGTTVNPTATTAPASPVAVNPVSGDTPAATTPAGTAKPTKKP